MTKPYPSQLSDGACCGHHGARWSLLRGTRAEQLPAVPVSVRKARASGRWRPALTLVELLAAIAIVSILAMILAPSLNVAKRASLSAKTTANMRQISNALQTYTVDNAGSFPGPLWVRQPAVFNPQTSGMLGNYLSPYIETHEPAGYPGMLSSHLLYDSLWSDAVQEQGQGLTDRNAARLIVIVTHPGLGNVHVFGGYNASGAPSRAPLKMSDIVNYPRPDKMWLLAEPDREWSSNTNIVDKPLHKGGRHVIFFDHHVEITQGPRPTENLPLP